MKNYFPIYLIILITIGIINIGCSDDDNCNSLECRQQALVGTWQGFVDFPEDGPLPVTVTINEDVTVSAVATGRGGCDLLNVPWEITSNDRFRGSGENVCGSLVTFNAPYSTTRLEGVWSQTGGGDGGNGTFVFEKE